MSEPDTKTCTKCGERKPLTEYGKNANSKTGLRSECKACHCAYVKARYHANLQESRKASRKREARRVAADPSIREAKRDAKRQDYQNDPAKWIAISRRWALANPEKAREYKRKWEKNNPTKRADHVHKRRARLANAESDGYTRTEIYQRDNGACTYCGIALEYKPYGFEIDHIVPIALGGPDTRANVQLACRSCNRKKATRLEGQIHFAA
jgi:5-methylcytosine-specific restriction endonuclease McrA